MKDTIDVLHAFRRLVESRAPFRVVREFLRYGEGRRLNLRLSLTEVLIQHRPDLVQTVIREKQTTAIDGDDATEVAGQCLTSVIEAPEEKEALRMLEYMLVQMGVDPDARDLRGYTPLVTAVVCGYLSVADRLIRAGAHVHRLPPTVDDAYDIDIDCFQRNAPFVAVLYHRAKFIDLFSPYLQGGPDSHWAPRHLDRLLEAMREMETITGGLDFRA